MRILLVRPPVPRQTIGLKHVMICEPLEQGHVAVGGGRDQVGIMDVSVERRCTRRLRAYKPDGVGSSSDVCGVNEVIKLCREAKRGSANCFTVVGGVQAAQIAEASRGP